MRDLLARALETGEGFAVETRNLLPDGSRLWVRSNVVAILDATVPRAILWPS